MAELLEELLARCATGDHLAAAELVRRFRSYAMHLAVRIVNDRHLAEDAVQEAFLAAFDRLSDLRTPAAFPGWLRQIVRTHAMRARRRVEAGGRPDARTRSRSGLPAQRIEDEEIRALVRAALKALPAQTRETAELYYLNELDHYRVADVLDVPPGTVKRRLHDARRQLRDELSTWLGLDDAKPRPRSQCDDHAGP